MVKPPGDADLDPTKGRRGVFGRGGLSGGHQGCGPGMSLMEELVADAPEGWLEDRPGIPLEVAAAKAVERLARQGKVRFGWSERPPSTGEILRVVTFIAARPNRLLIELEFSVLAVLTGPELSSEHESEVVIAHRRLIVDSLHGPGSRSGPAVATTPGHLTISR